eukprot:GHVS01005774.1.p2 GENE.GHVS01005774.1~~GHVS01005774.1.p2  ORF type:complete len:143 (+),score=25.08 GHVS01005774.1:72-500(+)
MAPPIVCSQEGSTPPCPISTSSTDGSVLSLGEAYKRISANCAFKGGLGLLIAGVPALVVFKGRAVRLLSAGVGTGIGFGWSLKEADIYLKNPAVEKCPGNASLDEAWTSLKSGAYNNAGGVFRILPEKWRSKTPSDNKPPEQ